MANKTRKRSRNSKNFVALPFNVDLSLVTLGDQVVADLGITTTLTEDLYVISVDLAASIDGLTAGQGVPSDIGNFHGDYNVTEVKEHLDVALAGPANKIEQERTRRLVRKAGVMNSFDTSDKTETTMLGRLGSRIIRVKTKFIIQNGKTLNVFIQNRSGAALTTGATLRTSGTIYGRWMI